MLTALTGCFVLLRNCRYGQQPDQRAPVAMRVDAFRSPQPLAKLETRYLAEAVVP